MKDTIMQNSRENTKKNDVTPHRFNNICTLPHILDYLKIKTLWGHLSGVAGCTDDLVLAKVVILSPTSGSMVSVQSA